MKILCVSILLVCAVAAFAQSMQSNSPVEILYGAKDIEPSTRPVISGILNFKVNLENLPVYPAKAKEQRIEGRVEVQILVNEDGEVIFANPLFGPEALWAESVKAAVSARFHPFTVEKKPRKITGRIIFDFKNGKVTLPYTQRAVR